MAKRIPLSFKENEEELKLYNEVNKKSCRAAFIKDAIKFYIAHLNKLNSPQIAQQNNNDITVIIEDDNDGIMDILG